jgi:hypothetical protein
MKQGKAPMKKKAPKKKPPKASQIYMIEQEANGD